MRNHSEFMEFLDQQARRYRRLLEDMFGQCDRRFVFGSIKKSKDNRPRTYFPNESHSNGGCVVDIHITEWPWSQCLYGQAAWQLAHESVHLLDPVADGKATLLEEGLATWFQDEPEFHSDVVKEFIREERTPDKLGDLDLPYQEAKGLVCCCMPQLTSVIKEIRSSGVRIQDITADELAPRLPNVDRKIIEHLCRKFPS